MKETTVAKAVTRMMEYSRLQSLCNGKYTNIITKDLPITFDRTEMTLQVETNTIGVIYEEGGSSGKRRNRGRLSQ